MIKVIRGSKVSLDLGKPPLAEDEDLSLAIVMTLPYRSDDLWKLLSRAAALDLFGEGGEGYDFRYEGRALIY